jgi:hypothetical protein
MLALAACSALPISGYAATDVAGAADPADLKRMPHSWIVRYESDEELLNREFVVSRVDKTRRDVRVERELRTQAAIETATYEMPAGTRRQEVIDHYLDQVGKGEIFACTGRSCGRSNHWANHIFQQAILYGPDANQFYFAGEYDGKLLALYVIERGNKRVYAHVRVLSPQAPVAVAYNREMADQLNGTGFVVLEGISPEADGSFDEQATERLEALADDLAVGSDQEVFVVCHLYGSIPTTELLERAARCSERAVELLSRAEGPELTPFAAGPLLPRRAGNTSRVELILPHRVTHN